MIRNLVAASALALIAGSAQATTFNDTAGDVFTGAGGGILDILSTEVTNDATDLFFTLTVAGDVGSTDWGKYLVIMDTRAGGDTAGNGWGRPISLASGADFWIGSWVDSGNGAQLFEYTGGAWNGIGANGPFAGPGGTPASDPNVGVSKTQFTVTLKASLASLGLSVGSVVQFDAFTSGGGGGDGAIDSAANPDFSVLDWGNAYTAGGQNPVLTYTVIPTPGAAGLVGVAGLVALRRRR